MGHAYYEKMWGIAYASKYLDRMPGTLRKWEREGVLPKHLLPVRDDRNRRYWSHDQLDQIKEWLKETDRRPGKGLPHYKPSPEKLHDHLVRQRRRRT